MGGDIEDDESRDFTGSATVAIERTREESRIVLDHQIQVLNSIDDKAMRTVRTAVITLSILVTAGGVAGESGLAELPPGTVWSAAAGGVLLFLTAIAGMVTYSASEIEYGISTTHRDDLEQANWTGREWEGFLVDEYDDWTAEMRKTNKRNERLLTASMFLLGAGFTAIALAGAFILPSP